MARHTRKGRNPGPVDKWLDTLGYYRKNVAYDETCLFRAVSEQIFSCQLFHEKIRNDCVLYATENYDQFKHIYPNREDWVVYLDRLKKHMAVCGSTELQIISKTYKRRILLFDGIKRIMKEVTSDSYPDDLLLCRMGEDHFDVVHKQEYIQNAGFCQSLIYKIVYEDVFSIPNVPNIVQTMLYQKAPIVPDEEDPGKDIVEIIKNDKEDGELNDYEYMLKTNIPPFPFKVAKALDPSIYRNIEYDTWTEMRKEMRLGEWYYGDNNLIQGSGCLLKDNDQELHCYIQKIQNDDTCVVYITNRAEKRTVKLSDLRPESDAKPWPLPYRFSKNLVVSIPKIEAPGKKITLKKRDKKNSISKGSNDSEPQTENAERKISAVEGAPLQMQLETNLFEETENAENLLHSQVYNYPECGWDDSMGLAQSPEPIVWSTAPVSPHGAMYNSGALIPTSPDIYTDQRYFYPSDTYARYNYNAQYVAPLLDQSVPPSPIEVPQSPDMLNYFFSDPSYSPTPFYSPTSTTATYNPQVEVYPQMYSTPHTATPIILTPAEVIPNTPGHLAVYSPAIEYMPSSPYIYPPTPPPAWYHPGINLQGFIFPNINQTHQSPP